LDDIPYKVCLSNYRDETSSEADLIIPVSTVLESWGDYNPRKGVYGLHQPVMTSVNGSVSPGDVLITVLKNVNGIQTDALRENYYEYLRERWRRIWQEKSSSLEFEEFWRDAVRRGGYWEEDIPKRERVTLNRDIFFINFSKARRFNWFTYTYQSPLNMQLNPDVTVREKGVMEKCTFCIQRILLAKDKAKDENRQVKDGEIMPACVQSCPAQAITFGNMNDEKAEVTKLMKDGRAYHVLEELNTKPSVTYLKEIRHRIEL